MGGRLQSPVITDPVNAIAARHNVTGRDELLTKMTGAIESIVKEATQP